MTDEVVFGANALDYRAIVDVAYGRRPAVLSDDPEFIAGIDGARRAFEDLVNAEERIYGVTTGFGANVRLEVGSDDAAQLARNLVQFHGCGTGTILGAEESAAIVATRLRSLCSGHSAVRPAVLRQLARLLELRILPAIPAEGSVGASGDLTPLSYLAAVVMGEREVLYRDEIRPTSEVFAEVGIEPLALGPKESLAIMNGTSVMTGLAAIAVHRADRLVALSSCLSAALCDVLDGNAAHFDARTHNAKPHHGQGRVAQLMRTWLAYDPATHEHPEQLQDVYSIRCAPHVIGVLADALEPIGRWVQTELNGCSDNPLFDASTQTVLFGGNFYGGHIALAMDMLKTSVASVADLIDRQMQLLCSPAAGRSNNLPANLVPPRAQDGNMRHGFKAMTISTSALAAEALKLTMPATAFSRSTESHNQDKVSMGTIAARDALRVLELTERTAAILLIALAQAVDLRGSNVVASSARLRDLVRRDVTFTDDDRRFDLDIQAILRRMDDGLVGEVAGES